METFLYVLFSICGTVSLGVIVWITQKKERWVYTTIGDKAHFFILNEEGASEREKKEAFWTREEAENHARSRALEISA